MAEARPPPDEASRMPDEASGMPDLSMYLEDAQLPHLSTARSVAFYSFVTLVIFSLSVALWTARAAGPAAMQCPDCNCGPESVGAPPASEAGAESMLGLGLSVFTLTLVLCVLATYALMQNAKQFMPACIVYVLLGALVGSIVVVSGDGVALGLMLPNQEFFFHFFMPPIMLEAGYSLNKRAFYSESASILIFAIPGTLITSLVFGLGMAAVGTIGASYTFSFWEAMAFGALLSAVDPVATLAVFSAVRVPKSLHFLIVGESVLNDAVAIVLYRTFSRLIGSSITHWYAPMLSFIYVFVGSVVVGCTLAAITALVLKHTKLYCNPSLELSFFLIMAYLPYPFCDGIGMSGILGILSSSIGLAHYGHYNLSLVTQISAQQAFRTIAFLAETFVFVYLGTALTTIDHSWNWLTIMWGIIFTLVSRGFNIYPLSYLVNKFRTQPISRKSQLILCFSGLRGAVAFALSLSFPSINGSDDTRRVVVSSTLAIVLFTVIVLGGGLMPLLRLFRVEADESRAGSGTVGDSNEDGGSSGGDGRLSQRLQRLDATVLKPWLLAPSSRVMVATNRTLQTLAVSDNDRLTPHQLGQMLATSAATSAPMQDEESVGSGDAVDDETETENVRLVIEEEHTAGAREKDTNSA